jgi:hypothetical protein
MGQPSDVKDVGVDALMMSPMVLAAKDKEMSIFAGTWDVTIDTPIGKMAVVFDISEDEGAIHGTASSDKETVEFLDAHSEGNRLMWTQSVTTPMKLTLKFNVIVEGDSMTGTSKAGILPASKVYGSRTSTQ